jgi:hypothetical protein
MDTFNHGNDSLWFVVGIILMWCAAVLDVLVTRAGIWYHGLTEGNPVFKKILPLSVYKFLFNGAAGAFADAAVRFVLSIALVVASKSIGYADNAHSYLPFVIAAGIGGLVVRNWLLIRKQPLTKVIGQVS